ncbi:predicted protein [Uncinocarpus reesii 1704]|uniref:Uncharacterized protein n=1 Tax=Uncinocarpus reesii (strain UAMH 1704) TaxID=336963 RepID=C4JX51_UNCRE|nr:uncharacterized protein UREG_06224 [Uncinocarpus reesii 1704]EEP81359.1 predicted protein [Uncinocarpus reesii 1704]
MRVDFTFALFIWAAFHSFGCFAFDGNYTISTFINGDFAVAGTDANGFIELRRGEGQFWEFETWGYENYHFIRDATTKKYIRFPTIEDGATAILSDESATAITASHVTIETLTTMRVNDPKNPSQGFFVTAERYDDSAGPRVFRLRSWPVEKDGQNFQFLKQIPART